MFQLLISVLLLRLGRTLMNKRVPQACSLDKALELILANDYFSEIKNILSQTVQIYNADSTMNKSKLIEINFNDLTGEFALIYTKIGSGKHYPADSPPSTSNSSLYCHFRTIPLVSPLFC